MKANRDTRIAGRLISRAAPPFVIAEISANDNGKLDTALRIVDKARKAGALRK